MCFSAGASFSASGVLGVVGVASLVHAEKDQRLYAAIPLIFSFQQAIEGLVWISPVAGLSRDVYGVAFLFIACVVWPVYVPCAVYQMEKSPALRKRILPFIVLGGAVSLFFLIILLTQPLSVVNSERHIRYLITVPFELAVAACYVLAVCGSLIASSHSWVRVLALASAIALAVSYVLTKTSIGSVWCYLAAILSIMIYAHVRKAPTR
jgi:hypothetical protein